MTDELQWLTKQDVADRLKCGLSTVDVLIQRDDLPVVYLGRAVRSPADQLERWMTERAEQQRKTPVPA